MAKTLYDKLWESHVVVTESDGTTLLYIDRHLINDLSSPQAFEALQINARKPWRAQSCLAVVDHNIPTTDRRRGTSDPLLRVPVEALEQYSKTFGITCFGMKDDRQGIEHVVGPEQGLTLPGMTVVCGDSHTSTHGAFA